jgi:hypothetical protein
VKLFLALRRWAAVFDLYLFAIGKRANDFGTFTGRGRLLAEAWERQLAD